jgi:rare lipoprotein A
MKPLTILAVLALAGTPSAVLAEGKNTKLDVERSESGEPVIVHQGKGSFYGDEFQGRKTATGEKFDQNKPTAASKELPLGSKATVTNEETGKSTDVIVNDRGPYVSGRVIDLSRKAAEDIGITKEDGLAPVRVEAKPSEQPTEEAKDKIEEKAGKVEAGASGKGGQGGSGSGK